MVRGLASKLGSLPVNLGRRLEEVELTSKLDSSVVQLERRLEVLPG
jgi:hypothetical protein